MLLAIMVAIIIQAFLLILGKTVSNVRKRLIVSSQVETNRDNENGRSFLVYQKLQSYVIFCDNFLKKWA